MPQGRRDLCADLPPGTVLEIAVNGRPDLEARGGRDLEQQDGGHGTTTPSVAHSLARRCNWWNNREIRETPFTAASCVMPPTGDPDHPTSGCLSQASRGRCSFPTPLIKEGSMRVGVLTTCVLALSAAAPCGVRAQTIGAP